MQISRGKIEGAQKVVIYGPEGIGKSSFASKFPEPLFSDTEGSTKHMDVARFPLPTSWTMLLQQAQYVKTNPTICGTYVVDTADWAERLCKAHICSKANKDGIEDFGYGKGYTYLAEEFGRFLNVLTELIDLDINVVIVAHAAMRKFEQPDELGAYDRWELKLEKKVYPLVKEWADMVLFCNYKTYVIDADGQGASKGTNKVQGGKRVMFTTHHPCWDAKNRHDLQPELLLDYDQIKHCITRSTIIPTIQPTTTETKPESAPTPSPAPEKQPDSKPAAEVIQLGPNVPKPLADLVRENGVTVQEIQKVVASRGYYPVDTPIENYDPNFIKGVLVGAWPQVFEMIKKNRTEYTTMNLEDIPFQ